jgi:hypothetical protein
MQNKAIESATILPSVESTDIAVEIPNWPFEI